MQNKNYEAPEFEVLKMNLDDIVCTSACNPIDEIDFCFFDEGQCGFDFG